LKGCCVFKEHHRLHIRRSPSRVDRGEAREIVVVKGGARAYLSLNGEPLCGDQIVLSGADTLRKVALAILAEVGRKGKGR
jgi:hypothetical protein